MASIKKIVLAYSGGLDTSVAISWLKEKYQAEIIAYCTDVGQDEDLEAARKKALACGCVRAYVEDRKLEFVRDFVFPAFRSGALYEGQYLLGTSLARPCIGEGMMQVYAKESADAVAHGATGKGNDQVRFELTAFHFDPGVKIVAPWREWEFKGRSQLLEYVKARQIPVEASAEKPYSVDRNLLHTSYEGGILEDPWREPDEAMFQKTRAIDKTPAVPRYIEIEFQNGNPIAVDGMAMNPVALLSHLNQVGGDYGVGRVDIVENRFVGMKSRGVYETPGGTVMFAARQAVESLTLDREVLRLRDDLIPRYATLVYNGFWFAPERETLQRMMDDVASNVTGTARLRLHRGTVQIVGRKSPKSLYRADIATFEEESVYDQRDAAGFIRLQALRLRTRRELERRSK